MMVRTMFNKLFKREEKPIKKESSFKSNDDEKAKELITITSQRTAVFPCIAAWISQRNKLYDRKICWWQFAACSFDYIDFRFLGETEVRRGRLYFNRSSFTEKVTQCRYMENGQEKILRGFKDPDFSESLLLASFMMDRQDARKLSYIDSVCKTALKSGTSYFNILEYEKITEEEFSGIFSKKEVKALMHILKEDFSEVLETETKWILKVFPKEEPQF